MFKILGTDDSVNSCDCCGKSNLKLTVVVDVDGEILNYGSVCATRHTGLNASEIKGAIRTYQDGQKLAATKEYESTCAHLMLMAKHAAAHRAGLVGKAFADFCASERAAAHITHREIANKFGGIQF